MADLHRYFQDFNNVIRLDALDENATLREKRDMLIKELREKLPEDVPGFEWFNQGSYAYNTGTIPKNGNYDIDVGIVFDCLKDKYPNPATLKKIVHDAITREKRTVRIRKPCVTVEYLRGGDVDYHVDLAIYVKRADGHGFDLAVGREGASPENRSWEHNDPEEFIAKIKGRFKGDDGAQMRHCIRYLKRWRDHRFPNGDGPISCALSIAAYNWFTPDMDFFSKKYDDGKALHHLVKQILANFTPTYECEGIERLKIYTPVAPNDDLLGGLTNIQMSNFRERLKTLDTKIQEALDEVEPDKACTILQTQFGDEFPVPEPSKTAKKVSAPYVSTGQSA